MKSLKTIGRKINKFFCWGPWQIIIPIVLAMAIAAGTIVESRYDAQAAGKLVYHTWWMYLILLQLCMTLIAVMIDRWPWKKRHGPFLAAHVGILLLLLGSVFTKYYGLDGTMRFPIGGKSRLVTIPNTDLTIWSSFDGDRFSKIIEQEVDFFLNPPSKKPFSIDLPEDTMSVIHYEPYILSSRQVVATDSTRAGSAVRFQLVNDNANINDWLLQSKKDQPVSNKFGLAELTVGPVPKELIPHGRGENELFLTPLPDGKKLSYMLFYKDPTRKPLKGVLQEGDTFQTNWMGLQFRLLRYLPKAEEQFDFKVVSRPSEMTTSAIRLKYLGKEHWLQLNDVLKIFSNDAVYIITYGNRRVDLGFDIVLKNFEVGRYQGTMRAASYQSLVTTPDGLDTLISMNEPLKYDGKTFYQASFQDGPDGVPIASILSVNQDPGRFLKYLGSLILSIGVVWLFYNRRKAARAAAPKKGAL